MNIADLDLRAAIMHNMHGSSQEDIRDTIDDAISSREEKALPGLGVLFEMIWGKCEQHDKNNMINILHEQLK
jgi:small acid-soluble spore protein I (minor)